jgi:hypothetical protein
MKWMVELPLGQNVKVDAAGRKSGPLLLDLKYKSVKVRARGCGDVSLRHNSQSS